MSRFREADSFSGKPAFRLSRGIFEVSLVKDLGWKYFRALKSLWIAWPMTIFPERSLRIWKGSRAGSAFSRRGALWFPPPAKTGGDDADAQDAVNPEDSPP